MQKFIRRVTITGIDEFTPDSALVRLSRKYPFVEWGVLVSDKRSGKDNRYPGLDHVHTTLIHLAEVYKLRFACHVCGFWARNVTEGGHEFIDAHHDIVTSCERVQLNISHVVDDILQPTEAFYAAVRAIAQAGPRVIIQVKDRIGPYLEPLVGECDFLFDGSGGRGVLASRWPRTVYVASHADHRPLVSCGYAGGLNPENLAAQIEQMAEAAEGRPVWIDVESGVRTDEVLDLGKVESFLAVANPYVMDEYRQDH